MAKGMAHEGELAASWLIQTTDNGNGPVERERESEAEGRADGHHGGVKSERYTSTVVVDVFLNSCTLLFLGGKMRRGNYIYAQYSEWFSELTKHNSGFEGIRFFFPFDRECGIPTKGNCSHFAVEKSW